jgi:hypothetical protein
LKDFFSRIDFGEKAGRFLQSCGVKNEPSPIEFAELLVRSSHELLNSVGDERYLYFLKLIAFDLGKISKKQSLIAEMKSAPILVAFQRKNPSFDIGDNRGFDYFTLASAKEIFINNNTKYQRIFNPLVAPGNDDLMENLYRVCFLLLSLFISILRHILIYSICTFIINLSNLGIGV